MATGETKLSYLDVVDDIQDGDTVPILRDGKNYMSKGLSQVNADLTDLTKNYTGTVEEMLSDWASFPARVPTLFTCSGDTAQFLTNSTSTSRFYGIITQNGTTCVFCLFTSNSPWYWGSASTSTGALISLRSLSGTSVLSTNSMGDPVVMGEDD